MDTRFTEEQMALRERIARFAQEVLAPEAERIDREGFDMDHYRKVMDAGLVAVPLPKEVGGEGMGTVGRCILLEEVSKNLLRNGHRPDIPRPAAERTYGHDVVSEPGCKLNHVGEK